MKTSLTPVEMETFEALARRIRVLTEVMRDAEDQAAELLSDGNPDDADDAMGWIIELEDGRQTPESVLKMLDILRPGEKP